ncbi:MAG: hypothetical protein L0Y55_10230 [Anaerolineales bacterium]|nr:hypothetical protein [Anaerolineales bacterium]
MSVLNQIAYFQNRRDEVPNQELARTLAKTKNRKGIQEIAENLGHKNKSVRSDCLKVLYEIGYLAPELIADYTDEFLALLKSKDNRMVWGALIALATIADLRAKEIWAQIDDVIAAMEHGTVISVVWGVKTLAHVAAQDKRHRQKLFPVLLAQIRKCIPRDVPTHAESMLCAIDDGNRKEFLAVLTSRQKEMTTAQAARLRKVMKQISGAQKQER